MIAMSIENDTTIQLIKSKPMKSSKRYYIHRQLKKLVGVVKVQSQNKTVEIEPEPSDKVKKYTGQLAAVGYNIQLVIPNQK